MLFIFYIAMAVAMPVSVAYLIMYRPGEMRRSRLARILVPVSELIVFGGLVLIVYVIIQAIIHR